MKSNYQLVAAIAAFGLAGCATPEPVVLHPVANPIPPVAGASYDISRVTIQPVAVRRVTPRYPLELRRGAIRGKVVVVFTGATDGSVRDVFVESATDVRFGEAAVAAVQAWSFRPAQVDGRVVNCRMAIPINFDPIE